MTQAVSYPHLELGSDGEMYIGKTRYRVLDLAGEHYQYGWSAEELLRQHPDLKQEEDYAALTYFYDHYDDLAKLVTESPADQAQPARSKIARAELLKRRDAGGS